ncbi:MAG: hypothetical protein ACK5XN_03845 [Bacteroidota bacterium]|jgi:hypothetical protein
MAWLFVCFDAYAGAFSAYRSKSFYGVAICRNDVGLKPAHKPVSPIWLQRNLKKESLRRVSSATGLLHQVGHAARAAL